MDRFAQSPLRLAAGFGDTKPKKTKALKYRTLDADPKILTSRKRRHLQPLALQSPPTPLVSQPRTEKAQRDFELSLQRRDFQQLLWLIANGDVPATYETVGGETALLAAIGAKDEDAFRLLLQCGISIDARNRHGYTPLMKAIAAAAPFAEAQLEETTRNSLTALTTVRTSNNHPTSENDSTPAGFDNRMIAVVLAHCPDLHAQDAFHQTAFDWATRTRNYAALALLEAHQQQRRTERADFADRDSRLSECVALLRHHDTVTRDMETLLRVPLLAEALLQQPIRDGVARVSRETFEHALNDYTVLTTDRGEAFLCNYFLDRETRDGWTPLLKAAACGFTETLQVVVALGVDVNYESHRLKHTALTWASYCGHDATVLALLRVPTVDVNRQTREGKTALIHAVANQQLGCIRCLLHAMHAQSVRDAGSKESFHANENAVRLQMSPTTRRPSRWGMRPLSTAGTRRKPGMYEWHELFLEMVSTHDSSGRDALAYANAVGEREEATAIQRELQQALQQAQDHAAYVASHQQQTLPTACKYASDGCTFVAPLDLLPSHELHACPKRQIACDQCGMDTAVEAQTTHDRVVCEQRLVACPNREHGCTLRVPVREAIAHARDHCRKRVVPCRLGCVPPDKLTFERRDLHETTQCVLRLIPCPLSCGAALFPANQRSLHTRQHCRKRVIPCPSGCGIQVRVDEMAFHVSTLCVARRVACQWASHGCGVSIGGTIASRRHHEETACPFRLVTCKHAACTSPEVLACFLEAHYAWQCSHELVDCPNACGVAPLPRHLMDVHTQLDAGDCWKRLVHCRRDLCGKTLRLYDSEQVNMFTSDTTAEPKAQVSMRGLQQRLERAKAFLEKLRKRQKVGGDQEEEEEKGEEEKEEEEEPVFWRVAAARTQLLDWIEPWVACLQVEATRLTQIKYATAARVRILSFQDDTKLHLVEYQHDGHAEWLDLQHREYDLDEGLAPSVFNCGLLRAKEVPMHEAEVCSLRLVACPLACGQRLPVTAVAPHLAKRCNLRNATCRLGCKAVLPFLSLSDHELSLCERRQVTCTHCHATLPHHTLASHLASSCDRVPRRCRLGCGLLLPSSQFLPHEASDCPKRLVPCPDCLTRVWFSELETHVRTECALRVFGPCDSGCGVSLRVNERTHHLLFDCVRRVLPCPQCHATVTWEDLDPHRLLQCPLRDVLCRRGCGQRIREQDALGHEESDCLKRTVFCENRCGEQVMFAQYHVHRKLQCPMRVVPCPSGCGDPLVAYQLDAHAIRCRQRLSLCGAGATHCNRPIRLWLDKRRFVRCATHKETGFLWAIKTGDEDLVAYFVSGVDEDELDVEFANGFSPLAAAASLGLVEIAKTLLRGGADVNGETSRGRTPLGEATRASDPAMVKLLLQHHASVVHVNRHGQSVLAIAESLAANMTANTTKDTKAARVLQLLRDQHEIETDHRDLFRAIACSDYAFVSSLLQHSLGVSSTSSATLHLLYQQLEASQTACEAANLTVTESITLLNESIADTEAKSTKTQRLRERVDDNYTQIATVAQSHDASLAASHVLENDLQTQIRSITALDLAALLNAATPPSDECLVVMKSICLFCGVVPRGRRSASEYSDLEWWKTAQALLMDRALLSKLRGYRNQNIPADIMAKVRRECLRTAAFPTVSTEEEEKTEEQIKEETKQRPPRRMALIGDIVDRLATWVRGVATEYKHQSERVTLTDKQRRLAVSLATHETSLLTAAVEMQRATRSLPARQHEVEQAQTSLTLAHKELAIARQRLKAFRLVHMAARNGHTPLSFACAVGNDAMVHMLLTHGASGGPAVTDREACAALIQLTYRERLFHRKRLKETEAHASRSDAAVAALVRNVAQTFLLGQYRRRRREVLHTHRVPLHEAVYNGHAAIAELLLTQGEATLNQWTHVFPLRAVPGASDRIVGDPATVQSLRRRGGWTLVPLTNPRPKEKDETEEVDSLEVETRLAPLTIEETLRHAVVAYDSKVFLRNQGGWGHNETRLSDVTRFIEETLARTHDQQARHKSEILARKNVAKKTRERQQLHAQLDDAIVAKDFNRIAQLLDDGAFADYETRGSGLTALSVACSDETLLVKNRDGMHVRAAAFLLDRGSNRPAVDFESSTGKTAFGEAAVWGSTLCAQALMDRGANVNYATRRKGETALMVAARHRQTEFVAFLLRDPSTDVTLTDRDGKTAVAYAREADAHEVEKLLAMAMNGGVRSRIFASAGALYHVCKWGCGFMAATHDYTSGTNGGVEKVYPLATHERALCPKRIVACPLGCAEPMLWAETVERHTRHECGKRLVTCAQPKCGAKIEAQGLSVHDQAECDWRMVTCDCGERMAHVKHVLHLANTCPQRLVACPNGCMDATTGAILRLPAWELRQHDRSDCRHRRVRCRNGCSATSLLADDREVHETQLCPLRRVECKWQCGETCVLAHTQGHHEHDECLRRQVACPLKCSEWVVFSDLESHTTVHCTHRTVACALGCGRKVPLHIMDRHTSSECRRRVVACPHQCGLTMEDAEIAAHVTSQCSQRLATCGLCGDTNLAYAHLPLHRETACRMRVVRCRFQCYATQPLHAHAQSFHEQFECTLRPIFCPLGCGETLIAHTLKRHEKCCGMRIVNCTRGCGAELREKDRLDHELRCCASAKMGTLPAKR